MTTLDCIKALEKWKRAKPNRCWDIVSAYNNRWFAVSLLELSNNKIDKLWKHKTLNVALNQAVKFVRAK